MIKCRCGICYDEVRLQKTNKTKFMQILASYAFIFIFILVCLYINIVSLN